MARTTRKSSTPKAPKTDRRLVVVVNPGEGEDPRIFECDILEQWRAEGLAKGELRLFDPKTDDRGPEVPFIATWGNKPDTWFPKTEGTYIVAFKKDTPEEVRGWGLGMGSCSCPQHTRAQIARTWVMLNSNPKLVGHLRVLKVPCVMRADHPDHPGGSCVEIDPATLPAPAPESQLSKYYG